MVRRRISVPSRLKSVTGSTLAHCRPPRIHLDTLLNTRPGRIGLSLWFATAFGLIMLNWILAVRARTIRAISRFQEEIQPILIDHCYGCHANGTKKGGVAFDEFHSEESILAKRELWSAVLKNVRAGIMPPAGVRVLRMKTFGSWSIGSSAMPWALIPTTPILVVLQFAASIGSNIATPSAT